eukprot:GILI01000884.1.p1 GENE.GILI01000884.1~~GILI01000884.1.p1  ORF type:complete len:190 (-),score=35.55 GILI01000884.1:300-824(-)
MGDTVESLREQLDQARAKINECMTWPRVGVGAMIISPEHPDCVLVGIRKGSHGAGKLALPGGHLEKGEAWALCASRELEEEIGVAIPESFFQFATVTNDIMEQDNKHYITLFVAAVLPEGAVIQLLEPHKCEGWEWIKWTDLLATDDARLFTPLVNLKKANFDFTSLQRKVLGN